MLLRTQRVSRGSKPPSGSRDEAANSSRQLPEGAPRKETRHREWAAAAEGRNHRESAVAAEARNH